MSSNGLSANSSPRGLVKSRSEEALHEHLLSNKSPSDTTLALQWINKKLAPFGMEVKGVLDLMDGKVIVKLLEIATGKQVLTVAMRKRMESSSYGSIYQRECVSYALNFMVENNMISKNQQIGPEEIVSGNSKMILAVIWAIIRFSESPSHEAKTTQATWHAIPSVSEKEKEPSSPKSDESVSPASLKRSEPIDVHGVATPESSESVVESPPAEESASGTLRRKKKHRSHKEKREKKDKKEKHGKKEKKEKKEKSERKEKKEKKEKRERDSTNSPSPTIEIKSSKRRLKRSGSFSSVSSDDTTASMVSGTSSKESTMSSPRSSRHADTADKSPVSDRKEQRGSGELLRRPTSRDVTAKMGQKLGTARSRSYTTDTAKKSTEKKGGTLRMFGRSKNSKDNANSDDEAKSPEKNNEGTESDFRLSGNSKLSSNSGDSISFQRISKQRSGSIYDGVSPLENMNSRDWAAREIYTSELQYLKHLDNLVLNYLPKMKDICSADEIKIIFSNVVVLKNFSNKLLQELEQRIANWTQTQTVGDIFLKFYPFFKAYNQYCNNYDSALACYTECMKRPDFVNLCNAELARTKDGLGPDLQSLLITPVQRIPRYSLLLKELLKLTTPSHPDYENVSKALEKIKEVTDLINWNVIQTDTAKVYDTIVQNVRGIMPYMMVHRKFIMEGLFNIALGTKQPGRFLPQWLLLFTDMIFLVSGTTGNVGIGERKVERAFTTTAVWQKDLSETNGDNYFSLLTPEDTLIIQAKDIDDKRKWMDAINQMLARAFKTETIGDVRNLEYKFSSGDVYKGDWLVAKMHGHGRFALASGKIYEGQFVDGVMEGQGTMDYGKKMIYTGEWRAGVPHGKGLFSQGEIMFYGVWKSGVKKKGEIKWANGDVYNGKFRNDRMHGAGVLKCGNGDKYDGEWKNNKRHGTGNFTSVLGYYDGEWKDDKREGQGKFTYPNGSIYTGSWKNDQRNGQGKMVTLDSAYIGRWSNDKRDGKGIFVVKGQPGTPRIRSPKVSRSSREVPEAAASENVSGPEGDELASEAALDETFANFKLKYDGEWKEDKKWGFGILTTADCKYEGGWVNDAREGKGIYVDPTGSYNGNWRNDKRHGNGTFASADKKTTFKGKWLDDTKLGDGEIIMEGRGGKTVIEKIRGGKLKRDESGLNSLPPELPSQKVFFC